MCAASSAQACLRSSVSTPIHLSLSFFFFNDTATTEIYTLSLHDALPICPEPGARHAHGLDGAVDCGAPDAHTRRDTQDQDRKSTRLNSSHSQISYAVFCLKKKKKRTQHHGYK